MPFLRSFILKVDLFILYGCYLFPWHNIQPKVCQHSISTSGTPEEEKWLPSLFPSSKTIRASHDQFAPCKVIQDSIASWIPRCGFHIPGAGFRRLPLWILKMVFNEWIPDSFFRGILGPTTHYSRSYDQKKKKLQGFRNPDYLTWGERVKVRRYLLDGYHSNFIRLCDTNLKASPLAQPFAPHWQASKTLTILSSIRSRSEINHLSVSLYFFLLSKILKGMYFFSVDLAKSRPSLWLSLGRGSGWREFWNRIATRGFAKNRHALGTFDQPSQRHFCDTKSREFLVFN